MTRVWLEKHGDRMRISACGHAVGCVRRKILSVIPQSMKDHSHGAVGFFVALEIIKRIIVKALLFKQRAKSRRGIPGGNQLFTHTTAHGAVVQKARITAARTFIAQLSVIRRIARRQQ